MAPATSPRRQSQETRVIKRADFRPYRPGPQRGTTDAVLPRFDRHSVGAVRGAALDRSDAVLCTDSARPYASFAKETGITHRRINLAAGRRVVQDVFHMHVNAYHSRLKDWMRRFRGVSTKYLANYLGWRRLLEREVDTLTPELWLRLAVG